MANNLAVVDAPFLAYSLSLPHGERLGQGSYRAWRPDVLKPTSARHQLGPRGRTFRSRPRRASQTIHLHGLVSPPFPESPCIASSPRCRRAGARRNVRRRLAGRRRSGRTRHRAGRRRLLTGYEAGRQLRVRFPHRALDAASARRPRVRRRRLQPTTWRRSRGPAGRPRRARSDELKRVDGPLSVTGPLTGAQLTAAALAAAAGQTTAHADALTVAVNTKPVTSFGTITVGTAFTPGLGIAAVCTAAGNVVLSDPDGTSITVSVGQGFNQFGFAAASVAYPRQRRGELHLHGTPLMAGLGTVVAGLFGRRQRPAAGGITYTPTTVAGGTAAGASAGSLATTLSGSVPCIVLSGALSVNAVTPSTQTS